MKKIISVLSSLIVSGITFIVLSELAYKQRGYFAVGGEAYIVILLFLLTLYFTYPRKSKKEW